MPQDIFNLSRGASPEEVRQAVSDVLADQRAIPIPSYIVASLPSASDHPNGLVRVIDNPQGTAQSNGVAWISDVDGSDLGSGNG